jgi:hypothetical protein
MPGPATDISYRNNTKETRFLSSARHKLNAAYIHGSLIIAGLIGAIGESWNVFILVAGVLTAPSALSGEIRLKKQSRQR